MKSCWNSSWWLMICRKMADMYDNLQRPWCLIQCDMLYFVRGQSTWEMHTITVNKRLNLHSRKHIDKLWAQERLSLPACRGRAKTRATATRSSYLTPTENAEAAAREMGDVFSHVKLKILEALTAMQERMTRLELSQLKKEEDKRMKGAQKIGVFQSRMEKVLDCLWWR